MPNIHPGRTIPGLLLGSMSVKLSAPWGRHDGRGLGVGAPPAFPAQTRKNPAVAGFLRYRKRLVVRDDAHSLARFRLFGFAQSDKIAEALLHFADMPCVAAVQL